MLASVSWAGFVMTRTVLDPGRSERLAEQIFENDQLRGALADRIAVGIQAALPTDVTIPPELIVAAADLALDDPAVQNLVRQGIVQTHRNALEGNVEPVTIDASALGSAARNALVSLSPSLESTMPEVPPVEVTLPTGGLSFLGTIRSFVQKTTTICAALALVGGVSALVLTTNRPAILRRVAFWAFGAAAFWMVVGYGIPWVAAKVAPSSSSIVAAIIDVFFGAMIPPAVTLAIIGAALLGASVIWGAAATRDPAMQRAQPSQQDQLPAAGPYRGGPSVSSNIRPPRHDPPTGHVPQVGQAPMSYPPQQQPYQQQTGSHQAVPQPVDPTVVQQQPYSQQQPAQQPYSQPGQAQPNQAQPGQAQPGQTNADPDPWAVTAPEPMQPEKPKPKWVDGVGYVDPEDPLHQ